MVGTSKRSRAYCSWKGGTSSTTAATSLRTGKEKFFETSTRYRSQVI